MTVFCVAGLAVAAYWRRDHVLFALSGVAIGAVGVIEIPHNYAVGAMVFAAGVYGLALAVVDKGNPQRQA